MYTVIVIYIIVLVIFYNFNYCLLLVASLGTLGLLPITFYYL